MNTTRASFICRLCLNSVVKNRRNSISIFQKHNDCLVSERITSISNIKIQENDGLPSNICRDCFLQLDAAINFKNKCETSNSLLRTSLIYRNKPIETENIRNNYFNIELVEVKKDDPDLSNFSEANYLADACNGIDDECYETKDVSNEKTKVSHKIEIKHKLKEETQNVIKEQVTFIQRENGQHAFKNLECNECGGSFKSKCKLRVHWKKIHLPEALVCPMCKRAFKTYKAYNRHKMVRTKSCLASTKISVEGIGKSRKFHCKKCSYATVRINNIITHSLIHSEEKPFPCELCAKAFAQQSVLESHKESAHKLFKAETTCQYCGKQLKGRRVIYKHLKIHSNKVYQCDLCKKALKSKESLITHIVRHSGIKPHTCEKCTKSYYNLTELRYHQRLVHEKLYKRRTHRKIHSVF